MTEQEIYEKDAKDMTREEIIERIVVLAFNGDRACYERFVATLRAGLPPETEVALRGSVITNERHEGGCFDERGPGTSDLDVTLLGEEVMEMWNREYFYAPKINTKPLSDETPEAAPPLNPLRLTLEEMVGRPVNFQAMAKLFLEGRDKLVGQPYIKIIEQPDES